MEIPEDTASKMLSLSIHTLKEIKKVVPFHGSIHTIVTIKIPGYYTPQVSETISNLVKCPSCLDI